MNLADALDELRVGILRDSSTLKSGPPDHYWTDRRLVTYISDAQNRFARLSLCIHDDVTPSITQIVLSSGVDMYRLDPSVLFVISAKHADDTKDMARVKHTSSTALHNSYTEDFMFAIDNVAGKPTRFSTDEGMDPTRNHAIRMRFFGKPDDTQAGKVVYLRVIRRPIKRVTLDKMDQHFEIPEEYHLDMLEWAAYRALRNWDIDSEDRAKAVQHKNQFELAVKECKKDVLRKTFAPLAWSFGGNGFSYVHN